METSEQVVSPTKNDKPQNTNSSKVPWSPWAAVLYAAGVFGFVSLIVAPALGLLLAAVYRVVQGGKWSAALDWVTQATLAQFTYVLAAEALTVWAIWWFVRRRGSSLRAIGLRRPRLSDVAYSTAAFVVYFFTYAVLFTVATGLIPSLNGGQKQELGFDHVSGAVGLALTFISLVVLPPIAEEIVFRGFLFTGLRNKLRPLWAVVVTSLIFASLHLQFGNGKPLLWVAALDTFTLSLVLCFLRYKTDSLWPGILLHGFKNGIAFVGLFLLQAH